MLGLLLADLLQQQSHKPDSLSVRHFDLLLELLQAAIDTSVQPLERILGGLEESPAECSFNC